MKAILSGLLDAIKAKMEKCSSAKGMWDKLQDLHSKGALTMTSMLESVTRFGLHIDYVIMYI